MHGHVFAYVGNYLHEEISVTLPAKHAHARTHAFRYSVSLGNKERSVSHWSYRGVGLSTIRPLHCHSVAKMPEDCCGCCGYTRASGLGRSWPECAVDAEERLENLAVCYRYGCLVEMQLAQFYGYVLSHQFKPARVLR